MAPHAGVIIAASVLVAAGIAAYENPQFREWLERSSQKVAVAFRSLGDDIHGKPRSRRQDSSMQEDVDEKAEERRRKAREDILEKGRALQEQGKRRRRSSGSTRTPSFDSLVDEEGRLRAEPRAREDTIANSSAVEAPEIDNVRSRHHQPDMHQSVDAPMLLRQLEHNQPPTPIVQALEPWESQYEQEMRNAWNMELPTESAQDSRSHASESLVDLTPTTEDFPDPDFSVPSAGDLQNHLGRTEYFSTVASQTSHTFADDPRNPFHDSPDQQPLTPLMPIEPRPLPQEDMRSVTSSSRASLAGSTAHINHSEAEMTDDDLSDFDDGIRTPASAWTEVANSVSGDD